jgi:hypothetical protein
MFSRLQDYLASGCTEILTPEEQRYYDALYAVVGVDRKYGKSAAVAMLCAAPFNVPRARARRMYAEAIDLFYADDSVQRQAHRNLLYDRLTRAAAVVLDNATCAKDMEIYGNLLTQAARVKGLDKPDPPAPLSVPERTLIRYELTPEAIGLPAVDRRRLLRQIDAIEGISARDRHRLKQDAGVEPVEFADIVQDGHADERVLAGER